MKKLVLKLMIAAALAAAILPLTGCDDMYPCGVCANGDPCPCLDEKSPDS